jgi:hypothetical protein
MPVIVIDDKPLTEEERLFVINALLEYKSHQSIALMRYGPQGTDPQPKYAVTLQAKQDAAMALISRFSGVPIKPQRQSPSRSRSRQPKRP